MGGSLGCKLVDQHSTHAAGSSVIRAAVWSSPPGSTARGGGRGYKGLTSEPFIPVVAAGFTLW
jgi:hypothetical protein